MSKIKYKACIYARLSKDDGDDAKKESNSISNQKALVRDFLSNYPEIEIVAEKVDDGYSGVSFDRPAFNEMMEMIRSRQVNCVVCKDAYGIIGLNSKDSADKGFLKLSPILFSPQKRLMVDLRRKHAQNEDLSAKRSAACNFGSTVSDVVPSHLLQRQSIEYTPDVDLHRSTVRYPKDVSLACAA